MTEQEIIALQADGHTCYLMQVGAFVHAYEGAAFAMKRLTGYKVTPQHRKEGDILRLGFKINQMPDVTRVLQEAGITLRKETEGLWAFEGGDMTIDASLIDPPKTPKASGTTKPEAAKTLLDEVLGYNLATSTPMAAMLFLSDLQQRYGEK